MGTPQPDVITIVGFWIGIISLIVGVVSLIFTILTVVNTSKIVSAVEAVKIKEKYPEKHKQYLASLRNEIKKIKNAQTSIQDGADKPYIISDLLNTCKSIQHFYDAWNKSDKKTINKLTDYLSNIPCDKAINEEERDKILKALYDITAILERIGELNDIGQI